VHGLGVPRSGVQAWLQFRRVVHAPPKELNGTLASAVLRIAKLGTGGDRLSLVQMEGKHGHPDC